MLAPRVSIILTLLFVSAGEAADLAREIVLTPHIGDRAEDIEIRRWQSRAELPTARVEEFERLAWSYVSKARLGMDPGYYKLAEKTADVVQGLAPESSEARLIRGHAWHNLHRFRDAESLAEELVKQRGDARDLALLCDTLLERGKVGEAVGVLQKLINIRPSAEAMMRVSHVRWLKGDEAGAVDAIRSAYRATAPADTEVRAWILCRWSALELQLGQLERAADLAIDALSKVPMYPPGLFARARARVALGQSAEALADLRELVKRQRLPEYQWWLHDVLSSNGHAAEAEAVAAELTSRGRSADPRTFALWLSTQGGGRAESVRLAREELTERGDVFSHDALAWAAAQNGDLPLAQSHLKAALAEGTRDARLHLHAGEVARLKGDAPGARQAFQVAQQGAATLTPSERALLNRGIAAAGTSTSSVTQILK